MRAVWGLSGSSWSAVCYCAAAGPVRYQNLPVASCSVYHVCMRVGLCAHYARDCCGWPLICRHRTGAHRQLDGRRRHPPALRDGAGCGGGAGRGRRWNVAVVASGSSERGAERRRWGRSAGLNQIWSTPPLSPQLPQPKNTATTGAGTTFFLHSLAETTLLPAAAAAAASVRRALGSSGAWAAFLLLTSTPRCLVVGSTPHSRRRARLQPSKHGGGPISARVLDLVRLAAFVGSALFCSPVPPRPLRPLAPSSHCTTHWSAMIDRLQLHILPSSPRLPSSPLNAPLTGLSRLFPLGLPLWKDDLGCPGVSHRRGLYTTMI